MARDNKTEKPTPRRRQKAREKGQVARSRDLAAGAATMGGVLALASQVPGFAGHWREMLRSSLEQGTSSELRIDNALPAWSSLAPFRGLLLAIGLTWVLATAGALAQGGLVFAPSALAPSGSRLSPASRVQQLFSLSAVSRLLKSLLPVAVILYFAISILQRDWRAILALQSYGISNLMRFLLGHFFEVAWKSALVLLVWSGADYLFERRRIEGELRMSRQELLDEFKETEGHPAVKARIRRLQRQVRRRRMLEDVKKAAVVVTNPSEFAVALEFHQPMSAPIVVAKGRNHLAVEIKNAARWHGIPMVENPPLAHALYRATEVGRSIPPKLYTVVAEVLAAIYRAQAHEARRGRGRG